MVPRLADALALVSLVLLLQWPEHVFSQDSSGFPTDSDLSPTFFPDFPQTPTSGPVLASTFFPPSSSFGFTSSENISTAIPIPQATPITFFSSFSPSSSSRPSPSSRITSGVGTRNNTAITFTVIATSSGSSTSEIPRADAQAEPSKPNGSPVALVGGIVGGIIALILITFLAFCFIRRRRRHARTHRLEARGYEVEPRRWYEVGYYEPEIREKGARDGSSSNLTENRRPSRPTLPIRKMRIPDEEAVLGSDLSETPTTTRSTLLPFKSVGYGGSSSGHGTGSEDGDEALSVAEMREQIRVLQRQVTILTRNQRTPSIAGDEPPPLYSSVTDTSSITTRTQAS